jgi:hypothetical protein
VIYAAYGGALILAAFLFIWTAVGSDLRKKSFAYISRWTRQKEPTP